MLAKAPITKKAATDIVETPTESTRKLKLSGYKSKTILFVAFGKNPKFLFSTTLRSNRVPTPIAIPSNQSKNSELKSHIGERKTRE